MPTKLKRFSTVVDELCSLYFPTTIFSNLFDVGKYIICCKPNNSSNQNTINNNLSSQTVIYFTALKEKYLLVSVNTSKLEVVPFRSHI